MAEKVLVNMKDQNGKQENLKPYVYSFRPVHLETSVDVVQKYNHYSSAEQHFKAQDEKKDKKVKCSVRKIQNVFFALTLLIIIGLVCGYVAYDPLTKFVNDRITVHNTVPLVDWLKGDYVILFGSFGITVGLISVIIRWILHPLGCKAKKHKHCCFICELIKFIWTMLIVGVALSIVLVSRKMLGFDKVLNSTVAVLKEFAASGYSLGYLASSKIEHLLPFVCIPLSLIVLVGLIVITVKHNIKDKNMAFLAGNEYDQYNFNPQQNGGNNQGMYNGHNPYNNDRVYYAPTKKSSFAGKILKALAVIIVIAIVYCLAAYIVPGLPLHNYIKNIL